MSQGGLNQPGVNRSVRRPDSPRRVRHGIRLKRKEGMEALTPTARRWLDLIEPYAAPESRILGLEYAIAGQVASFSIVPGAIEALVQGRAARPYAVRIESRMLERPEWDSVVRAMAEEAIYAAKLLAGELPAGIEEPFKAIGRTLLPSDAADLTLSCGCGSAMPCKHLVAVSYLVAERIDVDPLVLFALRGLPGEKLLERLQEARTLATSGRSSAHPGPPVSSAPSPLPPIEACLLEFWRPGRQLSDFESAPPGNHAPHALLRRLGPSPLGGRFPLVGLLASIYDSIKVHAEQLRQKGEA